MIKQETVRRVDEASLAEIKQSLSRRRTWYVWSTSPVGTTETINVGAYQYQFELVVADLGRDFSDFEDGYQGHEAETKLVFRVEVNGEDLFFKQTGYQDSYGDTTWLGPLVQVDAKPKTMTVWEIN